VTAAALLTVITTACATGQRPTLVDQPTVVDDAASSVMDRLQRQPQSDFVAAYEITPSWTDHATVATVTRTSDELRTQIGDVVYTTTGTSTTTCDTAGAACEQYANEALISDLGITHQFWGPAFRQRLSTDSGRRIGSSTGTVDSIAGQSAACVAVQVPSSIEAVGTVSYCALDVGVLGRYTGADGTIELTSIEITPPA
jgi:hypothetical protein